MDLAGSRKTYPSFVGGRINTYRSASPERADGKPPLLFSSIRGVAYKKYFPASSAPQDGGSLYTVEYDGSLYLYMDFFGGKQLTQRYSLPAGSQAELLEAGSGIRWEVGPDSISASGEKGYAVFRIGTPGRQSPSVLTAALPVTVRRLGAGFLSVCCPEECFTPALVDFVWMCYTVSAFIRYPPYYSCLRRLPPLRSETPLQRTARKGAKAMNIQELQTLAPSRMSFSVTDQFKNYVFSRSDRCFAAGDREPGIHSNSRGPFQAPGVHPGRLSGLYRRSALL